MQPGTDAHRYLWEGRVQLAGFNPYVNPPNDPQLAPLRDRDWENINHPGYTAIYGPVAQMEFALAAAVIPSIYTIKVLHIVWDCLIVMVLGSCLQRQGHRPHGAMVYGLCPLILSAFAIEGHVDSLMVLFLALTLWASIAGRMNVAGVMLGLAIGTKMIPLVLLPWLMLRHRWAAGLSLLVLAVCHLPYADAGLGLFTSLARFGSGGSFFSLLGTFQVTQFETAMAHVMVAATLIVMVLVLAWRRRGFGACAEATLGLTLVMMPIVHYWYLSWVLVFLPFGLRLRWIVAAFTMVVYFEAYHLEKTTGVWLMPPWAPFVVWIPFAVTWCAERWGNRRPRAGSVFV